MNIFKVDGNDFGECVFATLLGILLLIFIGLLIAIVVNTKGIALILVLSVLGPAYLCALYKKWKRNVK